MAWGSNSRSSSHSSFRSSPFTDFGRGGERIGRGWKRWEDIGPCLRGEEDARRFEDIF
ncbi:hypothetical protein HanPSC8_Chr10g0412521 [Helianthus annuus]|nr:hypothetical protein HanPSC8_Chr10g0412521 [Helianthus annuus]